MIDREMDVRSENRRLLRPLGLGDSTRHLWNRGGL